MSSPDQAPALSPEQDEELTLCMEPESATLTQRDEAITSGGSSPGQRSPGRSSPGQPPAQQITERKASDVSCGGIQMLEEKEEKQGSAVAAMATNWLTDRPERRDRLTLSVRNDWS